MRSKLFLGDNAATNQVSDNGAMRGGLGDVPRVEVPRVHEQSLPDVRGTYVTKAMIGKFVPTKKPCLKCAAVVLGEDSQTFNHSLACRARMEELMADDPVCSGRPEESQQREEEIISRSAAAHEKTKPKDQEVGQEMGASTSRKRKVPERETDERMEERCSTHSDMTEQMFQMVLMCRSPFAGATPRKSKRIF